MRRKPVAVGIALAMLLLPSLTPIPLVAAAVGDGERRGHGLSAPRGTATVDPTGRSAAGILTGFSVPCRARAWPMPWPSCSTGAGRRPSYAAAMVVFIGTTLLTR